MLGPTEPNNNNNNNNKTFHASSPLMSLTNTDLDQLNHILGVLGSPSQEDLMCIMNEKVKNSAQ